MHEVKSVWKGKSVFETETPGGKVTTSLSEDSGLSPKALMLDALVGCTGIDLVSLVGKMRLDVKDIHIDAVGHLTEEHPKYYDKVQVTYSFYGENLDEERLSKAVELSSEKYCGVMEMFRQFADVTIEVKFNSEG